MKGTTPAQAQLRVQVVLHQSERWLPRLVTALEGIVPPARGWEVALWDNAPGSSDDVRQLALDRGWSYVPSPDGNIGFGRAHNALAAAASPACEYLLLLNPDGVVFYDGVEKLMAAAQAHPQAALLEAAQFPIEHPKQYDLTTFETNWCSAACLLIRRTAFEELGGFDRSLFLYCEDVDLSWRAWLGGWQCLYVPSARFLHVTESYDLGKQRSGQIRQQAIGGLYLRRKYFGEVEVQRYLATLRTDFPARLVDNLQAEFESLAVTAVVRRDDRHISLESGGVYGPRRW
jgi:hypothetical protein